MIALLEWRRVYGDIVVADVAHWLSTPFTIARKTPIGLLMRMHQQAARIARLKR